ncbi:V-set and transmembrane domain-containing protein 5-like [Pristis pectinata]|uniref:V-set and transmembrane domain-containing protein 5-like n=1 Tax=Pristis pectinata TaxID=685728 RepID=UPI00223DC194|nr:V-set and transmembrane domain-containing protein 5-like [Pristis pectinata]
MFLMKTNSWNHRRILLILCFLGLWLQINGITISIPHYIVNATVNESAILSVDNKCNGTLSIKWKHLLPWGMKNIVDWNPGTYRNISRSYENRIQVYRNGSIQLSNVQLYDAGCYVVTVTDKEGSSKDGVIILNIYEPLYKDLHFVAVIVTVLVTLSTVLMFLLWICNQSVKLYKIKRRAWNANGSTDMEVTSL